MKTAQILAALETAITAKGDATYAKTHAFHAGKAVPESSIEEREKKLHIAFPPSYREFLREHGLFTLGERDKRHDHLIFQCWPLAQHRTALAEYAKQLECKATAAAVAEEIGVDEEIVEVLGKIVLVGVEGHEDFVGFDLRSRNEETGECYFGPVLFDDTEIEALADEEPEACEGRGFDAWLAEHIQNRA
jgi:hypothetical protein